MTRIVKHKIVISSYCQSPLDKVTAENIATPNGKVNYFASRKRAPRESERAEKALEKIGRRMNLRPDEESTGELICNPSTIILPLQHLRSSTEITLAEISRSRGESAIREIPR